MQRGQESYGPGYGPKYPAERAARGQPLTRGPEASDTAASAARPLSAHCTAGCAPLKRWKHSAARSTCAAAPNVRSSPLGATRCASTARVQGVRAGDLAEGGQGHWEEGGARAAPCRPLWYDHASSVRATQGDGAARRGGVPPPTTLSSVTTAPPASPGPQPPPELPLALCGPSGEAGHAGSSRPKRTRRR